MPLKRIFQRASEERRKHDAEIIAAVEKEFPPKYKGKRPAAPGLPAAIRAAR